MTDDAIEPPRPFSGLAPRAIRDAVLEEERPAFERQYRAALATAAETLDLTELEELLRAWHRIGELTERDGRAKRREILIRAVRVWRNRDTPDPEALRRSREFDERLWARLSDEQRREAEANRARMRRQFEAGEPITDSRGRPIGESEPYVLVPLDELHFDDVEAAG
ncbi:DUF6247 family protein [Prauserella flavalba]|uniref:DUF6247 family protein n=1 Tax=Prauserella flavalba TaxID=1477506 RepID=UPI0036E3C955